MAARLPDGTILSIAASYGAVKAMSAVTNANPGIATLEASHGVVAGDIMEVTSGWAKLNNRVVKAGTPSTNDIPLTGIDTSSVTFYPAGSGTGSIREIATWQQIQQVLTVTTQGGDQQFTDYSYLESSDSFQLPGVRSPLSLTISIADDASLPHVAILKAASEDRQVRAIRAQLPGSSIIYYNGIVTYNETPSLTKGQVMAVTATVSLQSVPVRY